MSDPRILVIGSAGTVGRHVVTQLREGGARVRSTTTKGPTAAELVRFDFSAPGTWEPTLDGVDRVFLMRPPQISDVKRTIAPFIACAARRRIEHVVFLSVMGVNPALPHWRVERALIASGLTYTFLRPSFFAQNLETAYGEDLRAHDRIRLPAGRSRTSFVDTRDVAAVATLALRAPDAHRNRAYTLTGPEALGWAEVARLLSDLLGRPIRYESIGLRRYRSELRAAGMPTSYVLVQLMIHAVARLGLAATITPELERLLGRPGRTLRQYLEDHAAVWAPAGAR
ncbi:MAG: NmrA family NAD(P)-binding protein [Myxococcota bacterium]|nr:NmrA family NAD(P)-binding protein [Myxococcota bacterium]